MLRRLLEPTYDVVGEATNGREALEAVQRLRPDVVLLDISMPVMGGFEAARLIRETMAGIRIIFASQHASSEYMDEAFKLVFVKCPDQQIAKWSQFAFR